ncbi:MAG: fibronectin type III domain-containing protein [Verrucomicrobiia bacterium]
MRTISEQKVGRTAGALGWSLRIMGFTRVLEGIFFFALLHNPVQALSATIPPGQSVTLAWNRSTDPTVVGYKIYYGGASGTYTNTLSAGNATNVTISGLVGGTTYYFAATTYNSSGVQSPFSNEVSYSSAFKLSCTVGYESVLVTNTILVFTNGAGKVIHLPPISTNYVATNMTLSVPVEGTWTVWMSTNLSEWSIYATGSVPAAIDVPIGPRFPPAGFFRFSY